MMKTHLLQLTVLCAGLSSSITHAAETSALADQLAALRSDVDRLAHEVSRVETELSSDLALADSERLDLSARVRDEELRLERAQREIERIQQSVAEPSSEALTLVLNEALASLRVKISAGLPYRQAERLEALDRIQVALESGQVSPEKAASQVWQLAEDELRLTRENTLDHQVVTLDGQEQFVQIARLGMAGAYIRSSDGRYGHSHHDGHNWTWKMTDDRAAHLQIDALMDALKKQVRNGWFEVPGSFRMEQR